MAEDLFGTDGSEYNRNTAFADGFDISNSGNRIVVGTRIFKLADGDMDRGDAIGYNGSDFLNLGEYATGIQPFSTNDVGDQLVMFKREYNDSLGHDEVNVYFVPFGAGNSVRVIDGLDIFGGSRMTQMTHVGHHAIVQGENGRLPITLVTRSDASRLDLVSVDGVSMAMGGYRFSESSLPSISADGQNFCFLSSSTPSQIWVASIKEDPIVVHPAILDFDFDT
jgi:hypothetical protein